MSSIQQQAQQAAVQGQQMLKGYQNNAAQYKNQYNNYQQQANAANNQVKSYTDYMRNAGSAQNQFHNEFSKELQDQGYNPQQMTAARANLNQAQGALSAYSDFANQAASKWGMNAGGFAAANSGALGNLNNNIASNQGVVNGLEDLYKTAQTGANALTGNVMQGEQNTLTGYQKQFENATNQRDSAANMLQFFNNMAQQQGGLNAQQQQAYAGAIASYAQAEAARAQAAQTMQQVNLMQNAVNKFGISKLLGVNNPASSNPSQPKQVYVSAKSPSWYSPSNIAGEVGNVIHGASQAGGFGNDAKNYLRGLFR